MQNTTLLTRTNEQLLDNYANVLKAMAHPIRMSIVDLLCSRKSMTVTEIYEQLGLEQAVASHHLGILRSKGVLEKVRNGKHTHYSLDKKELVEVIRIVAKSFSN